MFLFNQIYYYFMKFWLYGTRTVPQATVKSILNGESQNPGTVTIKKLCDGLEITLGEFFSTPEFNELEQEIK